jgi:hypothetical protein
MKLFLTGGESKRFNPFLLKCKASYISVSFCYADKTSIVDTLEKLKNSGAEVLIDAGIHLKPISKRAQYIKNFLFHLNIIPDNFYDYVLIDYYEGFSLSDYAFLGNKLIVSNPSRDTSDLLKYIGIRIRRKEDIESNMCLLENNRRVHGIEIPTKLIVQFPFTSVSSGRWMNGNKFGITYRYLGNLRMRAYNADNKSRRQNMKNICEALSLSHSRLVADDYKTVMLFNLYQWVKFATDLDRTDLAVIKGNKHNLQIKDLLTTELSNIKDISRVCDTCILSKSCPGYKSANSCVIERPTVNTTMDLFNTLTYLLSLQAERTMHGALSEKLSGGALNPDVSKEFQRTFEMSQRLKEIFEERSKDTVTITAKGKGAGIISQIFGANYGRLGGPSPAQQLREEGPSPVDIAVEEAELEESED